MLASISIFQILKPLTPLQLHVESVFYLNKIFRTLQKQFPYSTAAKYTSVFAELACMCTVQH